VVDFEIKKFCSEKEWLNARKKDLTASSIAALFGVHEFITPYALWSEKSGKLKINNIENQAIQRGKLLEPVAVELLKFDFPELEIHHNSGSETLYFRDPIYRIGATPDTLVQCPNRGNGTIQIKSVESSVFRKKWIDENGDPEPPLWIAIQASLEAYMTNSNWAAVAPIVVSHGIEVPLIEIPIQKKLIKAIHKKSIDFWEMIENGIEPTPNFSLDEDVINNSYQGDGTSIDLSNSNKIQCLIEEHSIILDQFNNAEKRINEIKSELKFSMKNSELAYLKDGKKMTWKRQKRRLSNGNYTSHRVLRVPKILKKEDDLEEPIEFKKETISTEDKWRF